MHRQASGSTTPSSSTSSSSVPPSSDRRPPTASAPSARYLVGDARSLADTLEPESVAAVLTSPPYWGRRRYTASPLELGRDSLEDYLERLVGVFSAIRPALHPAALVWINIGDTAVGSGGSGGDYRPGGRYATRPRYRQGRAHLAPGQWASVPHRLAHALSDDGWLLRWDGVWDKGRRRPESLAHVRRPGESHESLFLFTLSNRYAFDHTALDELGSVWHVAPESVSTGHQAVMPLELARRCLAPVAAPGVVLDPYAGAGTTLLAATELGRDCVGFDLDPQAPALAAARLSTRLEVIGAQSPPMVASASR